MSIDNWVLLTGASSANSRYMSRPSTKHVDLSRCFYFWIIPWWLTQNSNSKVVLSLGLSIHSVTTQRAWKIQSVHPFHQNSMGARWSCLQCSISDVPLAIHCILISMKQLITFDCELSLISNVLLLFFFFVTPMRWGDIWIYCGSIEFTMRLILFMRNASVAAMFSLFSIRFLNDGRSVPTHYFTFGVIHALLRPLLREISDPR